jgi:hypothetical protein
MAMTIKMASDACALFVAIKLMYAQNRFSGWGMVEQVRAQVYFYVFLSWNPTSDQVTLVEFFPVATNPT